MHKYHEEGKAKIFSILLYDVNDGNLCKVIDDEHYWRRLNAISLSNIAVIYLPSWHTDSKRVKYNNEIERIFNIENRLGKSLILVFQVDKNNNILADYRYFIRSTRKEDIYLEIKGFFEAISNALEHINQENEQNYPELFHLAKINIRIFEIKGLVKNVYNIPLTILAVLSGIKSFIP